MAHPSQFPSQQASQPKDAVMLPPTSLIMAGMLGKHNASWNPDVIKAHAQRHAEPS